MRGESFRDENGATYFLHQSESVGEPESSQSIPSNHPEVKPQTSLRENEGCIYVFGVSSFQI
jgi:hypothetical protein